MTEKTRKPTRLLIILTTALALTVWAGQTRGAWTAADMAAEFVPQQPDYADSTQWYVNWRDSKVDLFYIVSTETADYTVNGKPCHFADTYNHSVCLNMMKEIRVVNRFWSGKMPFNYYAPLYRQATMQTWGDDSLIAARMPLVMSDIRDCWDYYLRHLNHGRPFVLAGFSQGAHAVIEILKQMPDSVYRRMIAAYTIGYRITQPMLDSFPTIKPAQGATDLGVTINYNSVRSPECAIPVISKDNVVCINPVNWHTDTLTAHFRDSLTVRCDPESHLLIVGGFDKTDTLPVIGRAGNYHHYELRLYPNYMRKNIADRIQAYFEQKP